MAGRSPSAPTHGAPLPDGGSWPVRSRDLDDVLAACGFGVAHTASRNEALARLVTIARQDDLAARVVVQRLLPGLLGIARRRRAFEREAFDELLGAAWLTIRQARTAGREHLAAGLVRDAAYRAFTAPGPPVVGDRGRRRPPNARRGGGGRAS